MTHERCWILQITHVHIQTGDESPSTELNPNIITPKTRKRKKKKERKKTSCKMVNSYTFPRRHRKIRKQGWLWHNFLNSEKEQLSLPLNAIIASILTGLPEFPASEQQKKVFPLEQVGCWGVHDPPPQETPWADATVAAARIARIFLKCILTYVELIPLELAWWREDFIRCRWHCVSVQRCFFPWLMFEKRPFMSTPLKKLIV